MTLATTTARTGHVIVIPCSSKKLNRAAPAAEFYVGSYHRACRAAADTLAADGGLVLVLSALHGLVTLDETLAPYDLRWGDPGTIAVDRLTDQARALGVDQADRVTVLAGADYIRAVRTVWPEADAPLTGLGIGLQMRELLNIATTNESSAPASPHAIDEVAESGRPLYDVDYDYSQTERPFTVTIAGPGRHDGEKPYTYIVNGFSTTGAWSKALAWHIAEHETVDVYVVADQSRPGVPDDETHSVWSDLRPEYDRQAALDDLADRATLLLDTFATNTAHMQADGDVLPAYQSAHDEALTVAEGDALDLVRELATHDGR